MSMVGSGFSYITGKSPKKEENEYDGRPPGGYYNPPTANFIGSEPLNGQQSYAGPSSQ